MLAPGFAPPLPSSRTPDWFMPHIGLPQAAITRSGTIWPRQPNTSIGTQWPISMREPPGAGNTGLTMQPSGAVSRIGRNAPSLLGRLGLVQTLTPYIAIAVV